MESKQDNPENSIKTEDSRLKELITGKLLPTLKEKSTAIKTIIKDKAGSAALNTIKDDKIMREIFEKIYDLLPLPVRLIIKQEPFVQYCFNNKEKMVHLLDKE